MSFLSRLFGSHGDNSNLSKTSDASSSPTQKITGRHKVQGLSEMVGFFEDLGLRYSERSLFAEGCEVFEETRLEDYAEYGKKMKISSEKFEEFSHLLRKGYRAPMYVKWTSDDVGYGVFAAEDLPAETLLGEYVGIVTLKGEVKNRTWSWKYPSRGYFIDSLPREVSLDAAVCGNELRFLNHSDDRNSSPVFVHDGTRWVNCYFTRQAVKKDQELLVSYGKRYWKTRHKVDL